MLAGKVKIKLTLIESKRIVCVIVLVKYKLAEVYVEQK